MIFICLILQFSAIYQALNEQANHILDAANNGIVKDDLRIIMEDNKQINDLVMQLQLQIAENDKKHKQDTDNITYIVMVVLFVLILSAMIFVLMYVRNE